MLRVMETQLGASKAGCSTVSCCRAAIFDSQQKGNNKLFYLAQRKDKLRVQLPNALHLFFLFHWENSIAWVVLAWASQWWALSWGRVLGGRAEFWVEGLFLWVLLAKGTQVEETI